MKPLLLILFALIITFPVSAQDEAPDTEQPSAPVEESDPQPVSYEAAIGFTQEKLSRGKGEWRTATFTFERRKGRRQIIWGTYRMSDRTGVRDSEIIGGIYQRLPNKWAFTAEGMYSSTYQFVGKYSFMGEIEKDIGGGTVLHGGVRYTAYRGVKATTGYGLVEKYWGANRLAYTLYTTHLTNAGTAPSHRLQYNRYFGERGNTIGGAYSFGREHENLGPTVGILRTQTRSLSLSGRFWLNDRIGIAVDGWFHQQGDLFNRGGINVGTRFRF